MSMRNDVDEAYFKVIKDGLAPKEAKICGIIILIKATQPFSRLKASITTATILLFDIRVKSLNSKRFSIGKEI